MRERHEPANVRNARDLLRARIELARHALQDGDRDAFDRYYKQAEEALAELGQALHEAYPPQPTTRRNGGS